MKEQKEFEKAILEHKEYICKQTNAEDIVFGDVSTCDIIEEIEINGHKFKIGIREL